MIIRMRLRGHCLALLLALSILSIGAAQAAPTVAKVQTRFGSLEVLAGAHEAPPDALFLNGKLIYRNERSYLGIYGVYRLANVDSVLVGVNCGGSGCPNDDLILVSLSATGKPMITEDEQMRSSDGTVLINQAGERLLIDLGYEGGKRKKAVFHNGSLKVSFERPKTVPPLPKAYCEWVYDSLDGCIYAKQGDPSCRDPQSTFAQVLVRGLSTVSQHPAFIAEKFSDVCKQVCATGRAPRLERFREGFCLAR